jgi:F-type H+-transporting ATPase subunit b
MGVTLIVFVALFSILYIFAWGPILAGLKKREELIVGARDEAIRMKHQAEEAQAKLDAQFAAANDKIREMLEEARRDADKLRSQEREAGQKEAQAERERARREIETVKEQALQEIQLLAIKLSSLMSTKAVRRSITEDDHQRFLVESLDELKRSIQV